MIVVDTNIIAGLYFPTPNNQLVENLKRINDFWVAPPLWKSEFRNVASLYYRRGLISFQEAVEAVQIAEEDMDGYIQSVNSQDVLDLVRQSSCSSYDCEFVVLAKSLLTFLVTFDKQVLREFPTLALNPDDYIKNNQKKE